MPRCTYCGGTQWFEGPSGGMSQNILCANPECRHWFNYAPGMMFDDLHKVEPTKEEAEENSKKVVSERQARMWLQYGQRGYDAYRNKESLFRLVDESSHRGDTYIIAGYLQAMAEHADEQSAFWHPIKT